MPFDAEPSVEVTTRDRLIRLRDFLAGLPAERFDFREIGEYDCQTPACIAGWARRLFSPGRYMSVREVGPLIGLSEDDSNYLFGLELQDGRAHQNFDASTSQAICVLDHLIATGIVDWAYGR